MDIVVQTRKEWLKRFRMSDCIFTFEIKVPKSDTRNQNNPLDFKKPAGLSTLHIYESIPGGWASELQATEAGLALNNRTGKCVISHALFNTTYTVVRNAIGTAGASCYFNGEPVMVTQVEEDALADASVVSFERVK